MSAYKVVGRFREKELQQSWDRGKPGTQAKKRMYVDEDDYLRYSPELIRRWRRSYIVEVYEKQGGKWTLLKTISDN